MPSQVTAASVRSIYRLTSNVADNQVMGLNSFGVTLFGVLAVGFMMVMYALDRRHRAFVLAFAAGCVLSSAYGFLSGAWPFGVVELIWSGIAVRRFTASTWALSSPRPGS